jgi:hypothetical protein
LKKEVFDQMKKSILFLLLLPSLLGSLPAKAQTPGPQRPILAKPVAGLEGLPINSVSFWWKYHDDPDVSYEIEKQVLRNALVLAEVPDNGRFFPATYVGDCIFSSNSWEMRSFGARTFASSAECGQQLKPNQWYRWSAYAYFQGGTRLAQTGYFKTGEHQDIIIDTTSPGFTKGGDGWDDRRLGYGGNSLLATTTQFETENNFCQWEWTIPEERTYEVSVHLLPRYWASPSLATSEQVRYELWREGIAAPRYKSVKTIDQTQDFRDQWASLGTFHFKAGRATLRLSGSTGESSSLGRRFVCDAIRIRARLGTVGESYQETSRLRMGTRPPSSTGLLYPMNWEVITSSSETGTATVFSWENIEEATLYRVQVSKQKFENSWSESAADGQQCDHCLMNTTFPESAFVTVNPFEFETPYYWRARSETTETSFWGKRSIRVGLWSSVRQFSVIEAPTAGGNYSVQCREFKKENGIPFYDPLTDKWVEGGPYNYQHSFKTPDGKIETEEKYLESAIAWAQICSPVPEQIGNNKMPIALFVHGEHENCRRECPSEGEPGSENTPKESYEYPDWKGGDYTCANGEQIVIEPGTCKPEDTIQSHRGFDYLLEELARHGILAISISTHDIQGHGEGWNYDARTEILLQFLQKLQNWNLNGTDPFGGIFQGQLDLKKIGLVGHSRGGQVVLEAPSRLKDDGLFKILAITAIAPSNSPDSSTAGDYQNIPYHLLLGSRDSDLLTLPGLAVYQALENLTVPKMKAIVYGANHNYFNTIWTEDDASGVGANRMSSAEQQDIALTTITAFFRWHLLGEEKYREMLTGRYKHGRIYWGYDAGKDNQIVIDDFEPANEELNNPEQNALGGENSCTSSCEFEEKRLSHLNGGINFEQQMFGIGRDHRFFENTVGMRLKWTVSSQGTTAVYRTSLPSGTLTKVLDEENEIVLDISQLPHFSLQAANVVPGDETSIISENQTSIHFALTLETQKDGATKHSRTVDSKAFGRIPHPYNRPWAKIVCPTCTNNEQAILIGIRIPLEEFGFSLEELNNLTAIEIEMDAAGNSAGDIAVDDIFLTF